MISAIQITAVIAVVALMVFIAMRKSNFNRKLSRREHIREKQEELLERLRNKNTAETDDAYPKNSQ